MVRAVMLVPIALTVACVTPRVPRDGGMGDAPLDCDRALACRFVATPGEEVPVLVAFGTSLTADGRWVGPVTRELAITHPGGVRVVNAAQSARTSAWGLSTLDERVLSVSPSVVVLEFSVNDAHLPFGISVSASENNLRTLVRRIGEADPETAVVVLVTGPAVGAAAGTRPSLAAYQEAWRRVAGEEGLVLVDTTPAWRSVLDRSPDTFDRLVPDGLHPSSDAHFRITAPMMLDALYGISSDPIAVADAVIRTTSGGGS